MRSACSREFDRMVEPVADSRRQLDRSVVPGRICRTRSRECCTTRNGHGGRSRQALDARDRLRGAPPGRGFAALLASRQILPGTTIDELAPRVRHALDHSVELPCEHRDSSCPEDSGARTSPCPLRPPRHAGHASQRLENDAVERDDRSSNTVTLRRSGTTKA